VNFNLLGPVIGYPVNWLGSNLINLLG